MPVDIKVEGLKELRHRMRRFPQIYNREVKQTLKASKHVLWENVPSYPTSPEGSTYVRTGTLGRSLGVDESGAKSMSQPEIFEVKKQGRDHYAEFGTRLGYAPYVIGEAEQASVHSGRWWTIKDIADASRGKIIRLFKQMAEDLADFLDGRGLL